MRARYWGSAVGCVVLALLITGTAAVRADDDEVRLEAVITGTEVDPGAFGRARFEARPDRARFEVRVEGITQAQTVFVVIEDVVGMIVLDDQGRGELRLETDRGDAVPNVEDGFGIAIFSGETFELLAFGVFTID